MTTARKHVVFTVCQDGSVLYYQGRFKASGRAGQPMWTDDSRKAYGFASNASAARKARQLADRVRGRTFEIAAL